MSNNRDAEKAAPLMAAIETAIARPPDYDDVLAALERFATAVEREGFADVAAYLRSVSADLHAHRRHFETRR